MLLLDGMLMSIFIGFLFFALFTALNVQTVTRDLVTTLFMTIRFFYVYLKLPYIILTRVYNNRVAILDGLKQIGIHEEDYEHFKSLFKSRQKLFIYLYKHGFFKYKNVLGRYLKMIEDENVKIKITFDMDLSEIRNKDIDENFFKNNLRDLTNKYV